MTCNNCATKSAGAAAQQGAPDVDAHRAANTAHGEKCPTCGQFVSPQGGHLCPQVAATTLATNALLVDPVVRQAAEEAFSRGYQSGLVAEPGDTASVNRYFDSVYAELRRAGVDLPPAETIDTPHRQALVSGYNQFFLDGVGLRFGDKIYIQLKETQLGQVEDAVRPLTISHVSLSFGDYGWEWWVEVAEVEGSFVLDGQNNVHIMVEDHSHAPTSIGGRCPTTSLHGLWHCGKQTGLPVLESPTEPVVLADGSTVAFRPLTAPELLAQPYGINEDNLADEIFGEEGWSDDPEKQAEYNARIQAAENSDPAYVKQVEDDGGPYMRSSNMYTFLDANGQRVGVVSFEDSIGRVPEGWVEISHFIEPEFRDDPGLLRQALSHGMAEWAGRFHSARFCINVSKDESDLAGQLKPVGFNADTILNTNTYGDRYLAADLTGQMVASDTVTTVGSDAQTLDEIARRGRPVFVSHPDAMEPELHYDAIHALRDNARGRGQIVPTADAYARQITMLARVSPGNPVAYPSGEFYDGYYRAACDVVNILEEGVYTGEEAQVAAHAALDFLTENKTPESAVGNINRIFVTGHPMSGGSKVDAEVRDMAVQKVLETAPRLPRNRQADALSSIIPHVKDGDTLAPFVASAEYRFIENIASTAPQKLTPRLVDTILETTDFDKISPIFQHIHDEKTQGRAVEAMFQGRWPTFMPTYKVDRVVDKMLSPEVLGRARQAIEKMEFESRQEATRQNILDKIDRMLA